MSSAETILLPKRLDLRNSIGFARQLSETEPSDNFTFDFRRIAWVEPFGLLRTACAIRQFTTTNDYGRNFRCLIDPSTDANAMHYAAFMGFFKACNFDYGNRPGMKPGFSYVPIAFEKISELATTEEGYGDQMSRIARELTVKLIMPYSKSLFRPVEFSFLEIIRNVVEHSHSSELGYCAQYWPNKDRVEIAIVDTGIGLRRSLAHNPHLDINSDGDALKYALLPGVSGKTFEDVNTNPADDWENSGFGLYMNYRLCNEAGDFFICSGNSGLYRKMNAADNRYMETDFQGTILRLRLYPSKLSDQNPVTLFNRYRTEGEEFARKSNYGANVRASKISGYIRDNFKYSPSEITIGSQVHHREYGVGKVEDVIESTPEDLAVVSFLGDVECEIEPVPLSHLIRYDASSPEGISYDDVPY